METEWEYSQGKRIAEEKFPASHPTNKYLVPVREQTFPYQEGLIATLQSLVLHSKAVRHVLSMLGENFLGLLGFAVGDPHLGGGLLIAWPAKFIENAGFPLSGGCSRFLLPTEMIDPGKTFVVICDLPIP